MNIKKFLLGTIAVVALVGSTGLVAFAEDRGSEQRDAARAAGSTLEIHVSDNGKVLVRGAKVTAISGQVLTATTAWGSASVTWTVNTDSSTHIIRRFGDRSNLSEISIGDYVSFQGMVVTIASAFTVHADILKDWSVQKKGASFLGNVTSTASGSFILHASGSGDITVLLAPATVITKGSSTTTASAIVVGAKVHAEGLYNNLTKILEASKVKIYIDKSAEEHIFEATIKTLPGSALPTSFTATLKSHTDATVNMPLGISVVGKTYLMVALSDFRIGDKIRIWGSIDGSTIDASVVRNLNLPR